MNKVSSLLILKYSEFLSSHVNSAYSSIIRPKYTQTDLYNYFFKKTSVIISLSHIFTVNSKTFGLEFNLLTFQQHH